MNRFSWRCWPLLTILCCIALPVRADDAAPAEVPSDETRPRVGLVLGLHQDVTGLVFLLRAVRQLLFIGFLHLGLVHLVIVEEIEHGHAGQKLLFLNHQRVLDVFTLIQRLLFGFLGENEDPQQLAEDEALSLLGVLLHVRLTLAHVLKEDGELLAADVFAVDLGDDFIPQIGGGGRLFFRQHGVGGQ